MIPSETRLLNAIRDALIPLRAGGGDVTQIINSIDMALNELLLRQDRAFATEQVSCGKIIEQEAAKFGVAPAPASSDESPIDRLSRSLANQAQTLAGRESGNAAVKQLLARMVDWENALHLRRLQPPRAAATAPIVSTEEISADSIRDYLCKRFPAWPNVRVSNLRRPSGGFSKITVLFDVEDDYNGLQSLVIRAEQPLNLVFLEGADLNNEFHVLRLASAAGLPVAQPLWFEEDRRWLGGRFLVSRRAKGCNFGSRVDVRERISESLLRNVVGRLVQLHKTPIDPTAPNAAASHLGHWAKYRTLRECVAAQVSFWREGAIEFGIPRSPILSRTFGWLERNIPDNDDPPVLLHGDFGLHNLLISDDEKVSCILDWEAATLGDPTDDIVWLSEGLRGSVERDRIVSLYEELGGRPINRMRLPFFDVMCAMRFAVTCPRALDLFEQHPSAGLEALQLGLLYMYHGTGGLNQHIERADEAHAAR